MTKKSRFINNLTMLSASEKKRLIDFFSVNPVYESRIDWNNKNLKFEDFELVFSLSIMSKKNRKNTIEMFKNYNCKIIVHTKEFVIVVPLDWYCTQFFNSFDCGGEGAKWCIGNKHTNELWNDYTQKGKVFYLLYFFERHPIFGKKLILQVNKENRGCFYTQKDKIYNFNLIANYLNGKLAGIKKEYSSLLKFQEKTKLFSSLEKYSASDNILISANDYRKIINRLGIVFDICNDEEKERLKYLCEIFDAKLAKRRGK